MITSLDQLNVNGIYTYADYLTWKFNERVELIKGKIFKMSPAPSVLHQQVSTALMVQIGRFMTNNPCQVFHAPFDVRLPINSTEDKEVQTVLQPDITVVCNESKLDAKGCNGAPDLVVEIISPSSANRDLHEKYDQYEESGVKEYWVVFPEEGSLSQFVLDKNGHYQAKRPYTFNDEVHSSAVPGLVVQLNDIFPSSLREPDVEYERNVRRL